MAEINMQGFSSSYVAIEKQNANIEKLLPSA